MQSLLKILPKCQKEHNANEKKAILSSLDKVRIKKKISNPTELIYLMQRYSTRKGTHLEEESNVLIFYEL